MAGSLTDYALTPDAGVPTPTPQPSRTASRHGEIKDDARGSSEEYQNDRQIITRADREDMSNEERHKLLLRWSDLQQSPNIAEELEDSELSEIGADVFDGYQIDESSRTDWLERSRDAMDLAMQVVKERSTAPWPGSSNVNFPLMAVAAVEFNARAYPGVVADRNVVKGVVVGDDSGVPQVDQTGQPVVDQQGNQVWQQKPGAQRDRADRVAEHMSWQKLKEQKEWEPDTDKLILVLPIIGSAFRKTWFDPAEGRNTSALVYPKNLVINYTAKSVYDAPRLTEILERYPHQVEEDKRAGVYCDHDYGPPDGNANDKSAPYEFLEQHCRLDLDRDGYSEPYIVTIHKMTMKVARIAARYDPESVLINQDQEIQKIIPIHYYTPYEFLPNPDGGIYGVGFGQLLGPINEQINTTLNQMIDSATLQNNGGGFVGKSLSMHAGTVKFKLGEWKVVNALGSSVRDAVVPLNHQGPSSAAYQLLVFLVEAGREVASLKDVLTGDRLSQNAPATTILALIEQGLKVFTAIFKRIHRSLAEEFEKDLRLNRIYLEDQSQYWIGETPKMIQRADYEGAGVEPYSDPKTVSDMQKLGRAEFLRQTFMQDPYVNPLEVRRRILEAAGVDKIDLLLVTKQPPDPKLIMETAKLELQVISTKAQALLHVAQAYAAMAKGDVDAASIGFQFVTQQLDAIRLQMESLDKDQNGGGAGTNGVGNPRGANPQLALPPGNAANGSVPAGLLGADAALASGGLGAGNA